MPTCESDGAGKLSNLNQLLLADVPGATGIVSRVIERSAQEFFQRSERWREMLSLPIDGETLEYDIPTPSLGRVYRVLTCTKANTLEPIESYRTVVTDRNEHTQFFHQKGNKLLLSKPLLDDTAINVWVSLAPENGEADDHILTEYRETLLDGAKQYAYASRSNDLFDPKLSEYYKGMFSAGIVNAYRYYESSAAMAGRPGYSRVDADLCNGRSRNKHRYNQ